MERFRYDRSSKWLIAHHGNLILYLGKVRDVEEWRAGQAEVVQPRQLPDGLLEARRKGETSFHPFLIEIETYPERKTADDLIDDMMLVFQDRRELPGVVTLVLRAKGKAEIPNSLQLRSRCGTATMSATWEVVELWKLRAEDLLATGEPGMMPWVSLTKIDGAIEPVLRECRRIIDEKAKVNEHDNLLAVSQVLLNLNYNDPSLFAIFGGREAMIESPMLDQIIDEEADKRADKRVAEWLHRVILGILGKRFGPLPSEIASGLNAIVNEDRLQELAEFAGSCPSVDSFRQSMIG